MFDHRCVSFISLVLSGGPGITVRKRYLTSELAANFIELLHNSPALCNFIGNHLDSKLEPYPASIRLFRSVSSQSAVKILSFQLCVEHLSRSFCPGCCRILVYSQVNITSCLFDQSPHIIFKTILLFFFFFFEDELESLRIALSRQVSSTLRCVDPNSNTDINLLSV